jgi:hypothetical protein
MKKSATARESNLVGKHCAFKQLKTLDEPPRRVSDKAQSQFRACQRDKHEDDLRGLVKNHSNFERIKWTTFQ